MFDVSYSTHEVYCIYYYLLGRVPTISRLKRLLYEKGNKNKSGEYFILAPVLWKIISRDFGLVLQAQGIKKMSALADKANENAKRLAIPHFSFKTSDNIAHVE